MEYYVIVTSDTGDKVAFLVNANSNGGAMMIALAKAENRGITPVDVAIPKIIR